MFIVRYIFMTVFLVYYQNMCIIDNAKKKKKNTSTSDVPDQINVIVYVTLIIFVALKLYSECDT